MEGLALIWKDWTYFQKSRYERLDDAPVIVNAIRCF